MKNSYPMHAGDRQHAIEFRYRLCVGILYASTLLLPFASHAVDNKQQLEMVQQSILAKEKIVQQQQKQRAALLSQLKQQEQSIARSSSAMRDAQCTLETLNRDIDRLTRSIRQLQDRQAAQQKLLAQQLDAAFRQGQYSWLQLILNNKESIRSERILAYFSYLNEAREKTINDLRRTSTDLAVQKCKHQQKQQQQQQALQQQQQQQQTLQSARAARQKTLSSLNLSIAEDKQCLAELHQNETRLRDTIARAEREVWKAQRVHNWEAQAKSRDSTYKPSASKRALVARAGGLGRPAGQDLWPVQGHTLHSFGEPQQGELRYKGLVIAAPEGSEVKAIAAGQVLMADWLQGYGLMVVIEHGKGDMSLYGYNQSTLVNVGDKVKAGQPIALIGTSSGHGTPSLYFEIRRKGQAVNPIPWLGKEGSLSIKTFSTAIITLLLLVSAAVQAGKLAIVIDDFGYRPATGNQILAMPVNISIAVLPDAPYANSMASKAHQQGREILIHLPMAPLNKQPLERNTLTPTMNREQVADIIHQASQKVPYAVGLNNHMGSAMTSSLSGMQNVMQALSHYSYYFLDSMTISNSQSVPAAVGTGVRVLKRRVFLDDTGNEAAIRAQFNRAVALARHNGSAIAIGHPHPATVRVLQQMLPSLPGDIVLVRPSMLLNERSEPGILAPPIGKPALARRPPFRGVSYLFELLGAAGLCRRHGKCHHIKRRRDLVGDFAQ